MANVPFTMKQKTASGYDTLYPKTTVEQVIGAPTRGNLSTVVNNGWRLLQSYNTAGNVRWTAPDLFNGNSYQIGVYIVGGGGHGGADVQKNSEGTENQAYGGGSGFAKAFMLYVSPNEEYVGIVGAGGNSSSNQGGTTSFAGNLATGGYAPTRVTGGYYIVGSGGMPSVAAVKPSESYTYGIIPEFGDASIGATNISWFGNVPEETAKSITLAQPQFIFNPFTGEQMLFCGPSVKLTRDGTTRIVQSGGFTNGAGVSSTGIAEYMNTFPSGATISATKGTIAGCGGGAAVARYGQSSPIPTVTGADGADGGIFIYVRGQIV